MALSTLQRLPGFLSRTSRPSIACGWRTARCALAFPPLPCSSTAPALFRPVDRQRLLLSCTPHSALHCPAPYSKVRSLLLLSLLHSALFSSPLPRTTRFAHPRTHWCTPLHSPLTTPLHRVRSLVHSSVLSSLMSLYPPIYSSWLKAPVYSSPRGCRTSTACGVAYITALSLTNY